MVRNYVTHSGHRSLPLMGSQESEGGSLGVRNIELQHTITNRCPKSPRKGRETAMGRQVKELTARAFTATPHMGVGVTDL